MKYVAAMLYILNGSYMYYGITYMYTRTREPLPTISNSLLIITAETE